jgi:hypothetical protein
MGGAFSKKEPPPPPQPPETKKRPAPVLTPAQQAKFDLQVQKRKVEDKVKLEKGRRDLLDRQIYQALFTSDQEEARRLCTLKIAKQRLIQILYNSIEQIQGCVRNNSSGSLLFSFFNPHHTHERPSKPPNTFFLLYRYTGFSRMPPPPPPLPPPPPPLCSWTGLPRQRGRGKCSS